MEKTKHYSRAAVPAGRTVANKHSIAGHNGRSVSACMTAFLVLATLVSSVTKSRRVKRDSRSASYSNDGRPAAAYYDNARRGLCISDTGKKKLFLFPR